MHILQQPLHRTYSTSCKFSTLQLESLSGQAKIRSARSLSGEGFMTDLALPNHTCLAGTYSRYPSAYQTMTYLIYIMVSGAPALVFSLLSPALC
jgi:hypothetical protein